MPFLGWTDWPRTMPSSSGISVVTPCAAGGFFQRVGVRSTCSVWIDEAVTWNALGFATPQATGQGFKPNCSAPLRLG